MMTLLAVAFRGVPVFSARRTFGSVRPVSPTAPTTAFRIADGLTVTVRDLLFQHDSAGAWTVSGAIGADLFGTAIDLSAGITG